MSIIVSQQFLDFRDLLNQYYTLGKDQKKTNRIIPKKITKRQVVQSTKKQSMIKKEKK